MSKPKLRLLDAASPVRATPARSVGGGIWHDVHQPASTRARKGISAAQNIAPAGESGSQFRQQFSRILTPEQLWQIYLTTPDIRACVDSISRRISTSDWAIEVNIDETDERFEQATEIAAEVTRFLQAPVKDGLVSAWQEYCFMTVQDLLVFDASATELPRNPITGGLQELVPWRGSDFLPEVDERGILHQYRQFLLGDFNETSEDRAPTFDPDEILYMRLFPNTSSVLGLPLIETILNEAITMIVSSEHVMLAMDADEIPPGLLVLGGLAREASKRAKADLRQQRGRDHSIRMVSHPEGKALTAQWIEMTRSFKDKELVKVIEQTFRRIWRTFGVMPVEMGSEDSNRAHSEQQMDVANSHLITPILELMQGKINARVVGLIVRNSFPFGLEGDEQSEEIATLLSFEFDRTRELTPAEQLEQAEQHEIHVKEGILTRNEVRAILGRQPLAGADVLTVTVGNEIRRVDTLGQELLDAAARPDLGPDPDIDPDDGPVTPDADPIDPDAAGPDNTDPGPGEVEVEESVPEDACTDPDCTEHRIAKVVEDNLPSEWQSGGQFAGMRVMNLEGLAGEVAGYRRDVEPLYAQAMEESLAAFAAAYRPGELTEERAGALLDRMMRAIDRLYVQWSTSIERRYLNVARIGRDAAVTFTEAPVLENWRDRAEVYRLTAMGYLDALDGPIATLKARTAMIISAVTVGDGTQNQLATDPTDVRAAWKPPTLTPDEQAADVIDELAHVWDAQEHRIDNWSGRLVELANLTMIQAMAQGDGVELQDVPQAIKDEAPQAVWYAEWVMVGDARTCATCNFWGSQGFLPVGQFQTTPGGATECQARDRCVLVYWLKAEVDNGTAVSLSG